MDCRKSDMANDCATDPGRLGEVPDEFRSTSPNRLRDLAHARASMLSKDEADLLLGAAAEIEGSEEAYGILVATVRELRTKLKSTEANLRSTLALVQRRSI